MFHVAEEKDCFKVQSTEGVQIYLRKYPSSDAQVLHQIWMDREYQVIVDKIKDCLRQKDLVIIDAGANVGYSSLYLFHYLKEQYNIRLIVVEPSEENLSILKKNFRINNIKNYEIEQAGLFNKSCHLQIVKDFRGGRDWSLRVEEVDHPTELKAVEALELMAKYGVEEIDFFKIDIEGSEKHLFNGDSYSRKFLERTKMLSIEIHDEVGVRNQILEDLDINNFERFEHGEITIGINKRILKNRS
jgi:FkbM family methyltransferase